MQTRASPYFFGYVVGSDPHPTEPGTVLWKVKVQTPGTYRGRKATVDQNNVPAGIATGMDARFDLVSAGREGGLVAINATLCVRHRKHGNKESVMNRIASLVLVLVFAVIGFTADADAQMVPVRKPTVTVTPPVTTPPPAPAAASEKSEDQKAKEVAEATPPAEPEKPEQPTRLVGPLGSQVIYRELTENGYRDVTLDQVLRGLDNLPTIFSLQANKTRLEQQFEDALANERLASDRAMRAEARATELQNEMSGMYSRGALRVIASIFLVLGVILGYLMFWTFGRRRRNGPPTKAGDNRDPRDPLGIRDRLTSPEPPQPPTAGNGLDLTGLDKSDPREPLHPSAPPRRGGPGGAGAASIVLVLLLGGATANAQTVRSISPDAWVQDSETTITITGAGLGNVESLLFPTGITVSEIKAAGNKVSAKLTISPAAETGPAAFLLLPKGVGASECTDDPKTSKCVASGDVTFTVFNHETAVAVDYVNRKLMENYRAGDPLARHYLQERFQQVFGDEAGNKKYLVYANRPSHEGAGELIIAEREAERARTSAATTEAVTSALTRAEEIAQDVARRLAIMDANLAETQTTLQRVDGDVGAALIGVMELAEGDKPRRGPAGLFGGTRTVNEELAERVRQLLAQRRQ